MHKYSRSRREHAWLKSDTAQGQHGSGLCIVVTPKRFRHPSVMPDMLPHLSLNTSARSFSPTLPVFRPSSPSLSCPLVLDQETLRDSLRSGGSTKSAPPAGSSTFRKLERNSVSPVDKKPEFEIDLRVEGVPQDAILKDEEQMKETNKKLEKLKIGSCRKSIRNDLKIKVI